MDPNHFLIPHARISPPQHRRPPPQSTASKYGQRILRLHTTTEIVFFDVLIPVSIVVTACVPEIFVEPEEGGGGGGEAVMTALHSFAAGVVCVLSPIVITLKSIPPSRSAAVNTSLRCCCRCCSSLCRSNPVLASYGDVLLRSWSGRPILRYHWGIMVVLQTLCVGLVLVFFAFNELYAAYPRERMHATSFSTEFAAVTTLFFAFLIIARLGQGGGGEKSANAAEAGEAAASAVTVRDSNGSGNSGNARAAGDDEEAPGLGIGGGHANGRQEEAKQQEQGFAEWVRQFTSRVSIGE
jgi:hypothetical protein